MRKRIRRIINRFGERRILLAIAIVAFVAQLLAMRPPGIYGEPYLVAKNIVAGKGFVFAYPLTQHVGPTCYVTPLYTYLQVPFLYFGLGERGIQVMNLVFLQVACVALYLFFRRFTTRGVTLLIFAALSFYVPFWILAYTLEPNSLNLLLLALTVDRLYVVSKFPSVNRWFQLGILIGLQLLLRPDILLGAALFVAWLLIVSWRKSRAFKKRTWIGIAVAAFVTCTMAAPWTLRNYWTFHKFVLVSANSGMNLFEGNNPVATGEFSENPPTDESKKDFEEISAFANTHDAIDLDHFRFRMAKEWIFAHPTEAMMLELKKIWYHWFGRPIMGEQYHYQYQGMATAFRIAGALMLLFGLYGLYCIHDNKLRSLLLVVFTYSTLVSAIFFVQSRHRILKVDPFLLPLAVNGAVAVTFRSRSRSDTHHDLKVTATKTAAQSS
jgi:hypothetical protein